MTRDSGSRAAFDYIALAKQAHSWTSMESDWTASENLEERFRPLFERLAEDVEISIGGSGTAPTTKQESDRGKPLLGVYNRLRGKAALMDIYENVTRKLLTDIRQERPLEYFSNGSSRVLVLGSERYTIRATGQTIRHKEFVVVLDFRDDLISHVRQIADTTELAGLRLSDLDQASQRAE